MSVSLVIENARIIDPATNTDMKGALLVENGVFADKVEGSAPGAPSDAAIIDAKGMILAPGLVDLRTFTGEPGTEYRETLASASEAAAAGGVTSFLAMPDTQPVIDDAALIDYIKRRAAATAKVHVLPSAALTKGQNGTEISEYGLLKEAGALALSSGRNSVASSEVLRSAFTYAANFEMPVIHHVEDKALAAGGVMNSGEFATILGLKGIPAIAETIALERDLHLADYTGVRYHAAQISTSQSVEAVARHKQANTRLSSGVSINNLSLNETDIGAYRSFFKLSPPLRSEQERLALVDALKSGVIDCIHSGHDPQDAEVKRQPFAEAAFGAIGLETMLAAALRLFHAEQVDISTLLRAMTINPARLLGIDAGQLKSGHSADFILIDPDHPWVAVQDDFRSRSANSPFEDAKFSGKVFKTFIAAAMVHQNQEG